MCYQLLWLRGRLMSGNDLGYYEKHHITCPKFLLLTLLNYTVTIKVYIVMPITSYKANLMHVTQLCCH